MKILVLSLLTLSLSRFVAAENLGYRLICESKNLEFTLEIADANMATGKATLTIYDRVGATGRITRGETEVRANIIWNGTPANRYISGFNFTAGSAIEVEVHEKRGGECENRLVGGTRYRAKINSNQPLMEFKDGNIECESSRIYMGLRGGGTSV